MEGAVGGTRSPFGRESAVALIGVFEGLAGSKSFQCPGMCVCMWNILARDEAVYDYEKPSWQ